MISQDEYRESIRDFALKSAVSLQQMADAFNQLAKAFAVTSTNWAEAAIEASDDRNLREHNEATLAQWETDGGTVETDKYSDYDEPAKDFTRLDSLLRENPVNWLEPDDH